MVVDAPRRRVWRHLADLGSHVEWMLDAAAISFRGRRRRGLGTVLVCETRLGPLRTTDVMEVVEWRRRRAIGVRHVGLVRGEGRFTLHRRRGRRTEVRWSERVVFPWHLGGPLVGRAARPVLRLVWRGNLARLGARVERRRLSRGARGGRRRAVGG